MGSRSCGPCSRIGSSGSDSSSRRGNRALHSPKFGPKLAAEVGVVICCRLTRRRIGGVEKRLLLGGRRAHNLLASPPYPRICAGPASR